MKDKIWFTYKARIQAYNRLDFCDVHSQFVLVWYAILGVVLAILSIKYPDILGENTNIYAAILSVALLVISLVISNRDFRGRALKMRENYLSLQALYHQIICDSLERKLISEKYNQLLNDIENHKEIDDKIFRVFERNSLDTRIPDKYDILHVYFIIFTKKIILFLLYFLPLVMTFILSSRV